MRILRIHRVVNLGGAFGLLSKGDYVIGKKGVGGVDAAVLNHWLVKGMFKDGLAVIIEKDDAEKKTKAAEPAGSAADKPKPGGKRGKKNNTPAPDDPADNPADEPDGDDSGEPDGGENAGDEGKEDETPSGE